MDSRTAIIYTRVSTDEQGTQGASLAAQETTLRRAAEARGLDVVVIQDTASGKTLKRPGMGRALDMLAAGEAGYLLALRIDRISRSVLDFAGLMGTAHRQGWAIVLPDMDLDTSTPQGELMAHVTVSMAQYERRLIGERTREGMAQRKAEGAHLGRRRELPDNVVRRIHDERGRGRSLAAIARTLNDDGVPTAHGGAKWHASTVRSVLNSVTVAPA